MIKTKEIKVQMKNSNDGYNVNETIEETLETSETPRVELLDENYKPPNQLFVPERAKEKFLAEGYDLQWVRIIEPGTQGSLDIKNIQKKEADGYSFVLREDITDLDDQMSSFFKDKVDTHNGLYIVGDLALTKFPLVRKEQKRRYLDQRTKKRSEAIVNDLRKNAVMPNPVAGEVFETRRQQPKTKDVGFGE